MYEPRSLTREQASHFAGLALKGICRGKPKSLLEPAAVPDRKDPKLVHLDGLNLSRAWCMLHIAAALPKMDPARQTLMAASSRHADAALDYVASGDYLGEHWLATFAVYLLSPPMKNEVKASECRGN